MTATETVLTATETATEAAAHAFETARGRLSDLEWPGVEWPDLALEDVFDDVTVTVRRHPVAALALIAIGVAATCGLFWFAMRRRRVRAVAEQNEFTLAGVA